MAYILIDLDIGDSHVEINTLYRRPSLNQLEAFLYIDLRTRNQIIFAIDIDRRNTLCPAEFSLLFFVCFFFAY